MSSDTEIWRDITRRQYPIRGRSPLEEKMPSIETEEAEKMAEDTVDKLESEAVAREMKLRRMERPVEALVAGRYARGKPFPAREYYWPQAPRIPEPISTPSLEPDRGQDLITWQRQVMSWRMSRPQDVETCGTLLEDLKEQRETETRKYQLETIDYLIGKLRKCDNYGSPVPAEVKKHLLEQARGKLP